MRFNNTYTIAALVAGGILVATTITSQAGPSDGSNLGDCYNNWISYCNAETSGYPNSCYTESMDHCDAVHKSISEMPGAKLKSVKTSALRKATRSDTRLIVPAVQPVRRAN
ncbi:hypothetical protein [Roseibium salinum]|uniref:Uncharacterized protein n=1 Tax=Roseibium salinum TaxID=1604349 RepID=A0ABT3QZ86_9HYPH|nr:hypothetical protein [Roseibium sp. DSM 29163]MCX2722215.1 hypothetical protein [Roseibium sp. DSM 29163]MDN3719769.1 hypothetical protein [Roseibium salinum]